MQKAVKDLNDRSVKDPTAGSMSDANRDSQAVNPRLAQKLIDRKYRWEWNLPLGLTSIAVLARRIATTPSPLPIRFCNELMMLWLQATSMPR